MKIIKYISIIITLFFFTNNVSAQKKKEEIVIKTTAECDMCKRAIEKHLSFEKGVKKAVCDFENKEIKVTYNPEKTTPEKIRQSISNIGYDADDVKANNKAYQKLPDCCKKGEMHKDH